MLKGKWVNPVKYRGEGGEKKTYCCYYYYYYYCNNNNNNNNNIPFSSCNIVPKMCSTACT